MNIDKAKLMALAEAGAASGNWLECPATDVLALLAEIEMLSAQRLMHLRLNVSLRARRKAWVSHCEKAEDQLLDVQGERDQLKAENDALRKALGDLLALYEDDEGCRDLPEYIAGRAAMATEASHG
ncbi:hypothetical protein [Pseudomonas sp. 2835]|uniref:hypothetical protein n=1 Tax=Pseudomonas sp. 2835 TaxID=3156451 RepID=UPI003D1A64E8